MVIKMTIAKKERLNDAKIFINDKRTLPLIELRNLYKNRYHVDNICAYRELALLGIEEAKEKINNINQNREARKQQKLNEKLKEKKEEDLLIQELEALEATISNSNKYNSESSIDDKIDGDLPF